MRAAPEDEQIDGEEGDDRSDRGGPRGCRYLEYRSGMS